MYSLGRILKIVLSWLSGHPRQWKTFVANRTSEIIEVLPTKHWRHVPSKENPADIASRVLVVGLPRHIYSDNGTNFVGARRKLDEIRKLWLSLPTNEAISYYLSKSSIDWHFIPPSSPHFGVPEELPSASNHGDRWELLQNIKRGFWKKWSSEFISSLQPRKKWQDAQPNLKEDDIVLIKEEGPPGTWPMARVLQVHPGNEGLVRVATVKTQDSVFKRPVHKLHKLPIYPN
ncbi:integrase catalytic domain-containing protein [Trichonephila clavipes]|nr:integrase catalytic domain-containing protein [Trichonephila clavipes]